MINLSKSNKKAVVEKIKTYFKEELEQDIGSFDAEFLLDFFISEIGAYFYNQALSDAHLLLERHMETMTEIIYDLEKPV